MNQPEVSCSLEPKELPARVAEWRSLLASVVERAPIEGGIRVRFAPGVQAATVADLASRELGCCSFFEFSLHLSHAGLTLEVRAPAKGEALLASLFGTVAGPGA